MYDSQNQQRPDATPIKNPLLSASITGLTFDDFPNKPILLPAAPPVVHAPILPPAVTPTGIVAREPKSLVTVGSSSLDTENLDEINLNASNEEHQSTDINDPNSNPLCEQANQSINSDSILSQAASSFSALPSVASNVFSTFSKRITAISSRETTPSYDKYQQDSNANTLTSQLDTQQTYTQQGVIPQAPPPFYAPPQGGSNFSGTTETFIQQDIQAEPPKLYSPADVPSMPSNVVCSSANVSGQNNFRFSSKKKLYAPIPGLSDSNQKPSAILDTSVVYAPVLTANNFYQQSPQYSTSEEQKSEDYILGSGIFSKISNLAPSGVFQNLTGLVQSATESLTQTIKTDSYQQAPCPTFDQQKNYYTGPPPPTNYFVPPSFSGRQTNLETDITTTDNTQPSSFESQPSLPEPVNIFNPLSTVATLPPASINFQNTPLESTEISQTQIPLLNPSNLSPHLNQNPQLTRPHRPPSRHSSHSTSSYLTINANEQPVTTFYNTSTTQTNTTESTLNTALLGKFFDSSNSQTSANNRTIGTSTPLPTPTAESKIPPPTGGVTSYRLQKGTKLYKNPLTPQETAPIHATPNQIEIIKQPLTIYPPQANFTTPQSVPLFAPPPIADPVTDLNPVTDKSDDNLLFSPVGELKSNKITESVALFAPDTEAIQIIPQVKELKFEEPAKRQQFLAPPAKKLRSNEPEEKFFDQKKLKEPKNNSSGHKVTAEVIQPLDTVQNKFVSQILTQDKKSQLVDSKITQPNFESIEPVLEENISGIISKEDPLELTLQKLSLTNETAADNKTVKLPSITQANLFNNPYRRSFNTETPKSRASQPILANFFTPLPSSNLDDLNFFASLPDQETSLNNSNSSGVNFFSETVQEIELDETNQGDENNLFAADIKPDLIPLEPYTAVNPPITAFFPNFPPLDGSDIEDKKILKDLNEQFSQGNVYPPPIGFESFIPTPTSETVIPDNTTVQLKNSTSQPESKSQTQQPENVNRFSNYFNETNQKLETAKDPSNFFDSFTGQQLKQPQQHVEVPAPSVVTNEEQRIQYFFNNPPPKDASAVGDLNYDLVHSGLGVKNLQKRSLTPVSNLVEPPSSACSEFSEISNSTAGQKSIAANLSITDSGEKSIEKEESKSIGSSVSLDRNITIADATTSPAKHNEEQLLEGILKELGMANAPSATVASVSYKPAVKHWFFKRIIGDKIIWVPFSHYDSALLETSLSIEDDTHNIVAVEGGRYDVNVCERKKLSVYWDSEPIEVRRCSWFYKAVDSKYIPYEEQTAELLENEFRQAAESGVWHKTITLGMGEQVVFHGPTVIVHFQQRQNSDAWGGTSQTATRPRVVKRDLDDFNIEQGESQKVDHLLFMVHGIGSACDLKFRSVEEVVEDFRTIAHQLVQSHYKNSTELGLVGRVEVLPISWHSHLHSVEMGIDEKLRMITLESIPKLRNFTNDTLLDILFYTSPTFCQKIMNTIVQSMNTLYVKYRERHPEFNGGVSLAGHSLGSLIVFDLLCHQNPIKENEEKIAEISDKILLPSSSSNTEMDSNQHISYTMGPAGTGQPFINYAQLIFQPKKFFALGSPIGMFVTIRGIDKLGLDFRLPTCPGFYNIFHPYDPVAYRIEALVNPDLSGIRPVLIPHHKGRKRMHLELKETMTRVSMDLKSRFLDKFKNTLDTINIFASTSKSTKEAEELMEKEVDKVIKMQMQLEQQNHNRNNNLATESEVQNVAPTTSRQRTDSVSTGMSDDLVEIEFPLGKLNDSKRIDYVLQEAPLEFINEYIFALSSHVCYWDSEDTILFVMKEIYSGLGISPDSQVPQQTMTIERPSSRNSILSS